MVKQFISYILFDESNLIQATVNYSKVNRQRQRQSYDQVYIVRKTLFYRFNTQLYKFKKYKSIIFNKYSLLLNQNRLEMSFKKYTASNKFLNRYLSKKKLGKGAYGDVFLVADEQQEGKEYALKIIDRRKMEGENQCLVDYLESEIEVMRVVQFEHIVKLHDFLNDDDYYYILLEYCDGGDLMNLQATLPNKVFSLEQACQYLSQVIKGLEELHSRGYLHRDIKPQNVLVKRIGQLNVSMQFIKMLKIADFGFSKKASNIFGTVLGTEQFMSPEIYKAGVEETDEEHSYGYEVDMWAFGVLMFYMLNLSYPFEINPYWSIQDKYKALSKEAQAFSYKKTVLNSRKKIMENCTEEVEDLFRKIFRDNPQKRIRFNQIRQHILFQKYFPQPSPASKLLYINKFKSSILRKSQFKNKLSSRLSQLSTDKIRVPSVIQPIEEEHSSAFFSEKEILLLEMEEISYLSEIASEIETVEGQVGAMQVLMCAFNLTKYYIVLLRKHLSALHSQNYSQKYPQKAWKQFFISPDFFKLKKEIAVKLNSAQIHYSELYLKCKAQLPLLSTLNTHFKAAFSQEILYDQEFSGDFFRSYRKSTDLMYSSIKEHLKTNKALQFYYFLCVVCICHVFDQFYSDSNNKKQILSSFLQEEPSKMFSFNKFGYQLRNGNKENLLKLAKKIIERLMMKS